MAAHTAIARSDDDQKTEAKLDSIIRQIEIDRGPDSVTVRSETGKIGVYTVQNGSLTYQSGPKAVSGQKAKQYLIADIEAGRVPEQL